MLSLFQSGYWFCPFLSFYLSKLLHVYTPSRTPRSSSDTRLFAINRYKRKQHGFRSFADCGPHTWNDLLFDIRHCDTLSSFKNRLKTHLFSQCYSLSQTPVLSFFSFCVCVCMRACVCVCACVRACVRPQVFCITTVFVLFCFDRFALVLSL